MVASQLNHQIILLLKLPFKIRDVSKWSIIMHASYTTFISEINIVTFSVMSIPMMARSSTNFGIFRVLLVILPLMLKKKEKELWFKKKYFSEER